MHDLSVGPLYNQINKRVSTRFVGGRLNGGMSPSVLSVILLIIQYTSVLTASPQAPPPPPSIEGAAIEDWFGRKQAPPTISRGQYPTTVVLADDIDLSNRTYDVRFSTAPQNIVILANTIRLRNEVVFNLNPDPAYVSSGTGVQRSGGTLVLLARTMRFEDGAAIRFNGSAAPDVFGRYYASDGSRNGSVFISTERLELAPSVRSQAITKLSRQMPTPTLGAVGQLLTSDARAALLRNIASAYSEESMRDAITKLVNSKSRVDVELTDISSYLNTKAADNLLEREPGKAVIEAFLMTSFDSPLPLRGSIMASTSWENLYDNFMPLRQAISRWSVRWYQQQLARGTTALLRNERAQLYEIFESIERFPTREIDGEDIVKYNDAASRLIDLKQRAQLALYTKAVTTSVGGADVTIDAFGERNSTRLRIMPTNVLIKTITYNTQQYVGITSFDPTAPQELTFYVTADLSIDPRVASAVNNTLTQRGQILEGQFLQWRVKTATFGEVPGLVSDKSSIAIQGTHLRAKVVLSTDGLGVLGLATFTNRPGIPFSVIWEYLDDPAYTGTLSNLWLSRATRSSPNITLSNNMVHNNEKRTVSVRFVKTGNATFYTYGTQLPTVSPGQDVTLPLPQGINPRNISLPPEAIEVTYTTANDFADFYSLHGEQLVEEVRIKNEIASTSGRGASLSYLELVVKNSGDESGLDQVSTIRLAPSGLPGDEQSSWFIRPRQSPTNITIEGRAVYADNSMILLKKKAFTLPVIHVTGDLLLP
jgi:hypothetical protein